MFQLRELPYNKNEFSGFLSEEAFEYHYGKHHQTYVNNLNNLIKGTEFENATLGEIILKSKGGIFNNAAQVYNHNFYWDCISPKETKLSDELSNAINAAFGSLEAFKEAFITSSTTLFGSGWNWLVYDVKNKKLEIVQTSNAATPATESKVPLLVVDVWEHAYYIDHRNARPAYLEAFWKHINWNFVSEAYEWALKEGINSFHFYTK
uniref:Superoxide dismutase n=1 Tax=uncultured Helicobacter sp. TaxID=175537 RepID=A0A650EM98_9HELI|nr:superoxide dismutase [Fe] [uncultured Helicobacter sp.]